MSRIGGPLLHPQPLSPPTWQSCLLASQGMSGSQAPVSLLNKGRGGVGRGLKPFAIREQPQPKITLERRAENCYLLPALKLEAGRFECVCACTHPPTTTICCRESHTVRPFNPAGPTQLSTLFPRLSEGSTLLRKEKHFFACLLWWLQQQQH